LVPAKSFHATQRIGAKRVPSCYRRRWLASTSNREAGARLQQMEGFFAGKRWPPTGEGTVRLPPPRRCPHFGRPEVVMERLPKEQFLGRGDQMHGQKYELIQPHQGEDGADEQIAAQEPARELWQPAGSAICNKH